MVYERKEKTPLTVEVPADDLEEKTRIINALVKPEFRDQVVEKATEDGKSVVSIPYFGVGAYLPRPLADEIHMDNFRFLLEQHIFSKEFLGFLTRLSGFNQIGDFNPRTIPNRIVSTKTVPERLRLSMHKVLKLHFNFFLSVVSKTDDNNVTFPTDSVSDAIHDEPDENHVILS